MQHQKSSQFRRRPRGRDRGSLIGTVRLLWPYIWPADRLDLKFRIVLAVALMLASKAVTVATPYALKWATNALTPNASREAAALPGALTGAIALTVLYGAMRILMALTQQGRDALFAAVAMNAVQASRRRSLRSSASLVAALSPRAQDRRPDAGSRTRPQRDRDDHSHVDAGRRADDRRVLADRRRLPLFVRLALRPGDQRHGGRLSRLYDDRDQLAHRHPPLDERERHRRQHQGDRQPAQFRDGEIFRRRTARSGALRQVDGALRAPQREDLRLAGGAERRAGRHLHHRHDRRPRHVRRRHPRPSQRRRRFRAAQRDDVAALSAAQFHGHGVSRHQAGDRRHRDDVRHPVAEPRDSRSPRRAPARRRAGRGAVRQRRVRLRPRAQDPARRLLRGAGGAHDRHRRAVGSGKVDDLAPVVSLLRTERRAHHDRRAGHFASHAIESARRHRHGAAGHRAVQRHHPLQHSLRPRRRERTGGRGRRRRRADRRLHPLAASRL